MKAAWRQFQFKKTRSISEDKLRSFLEGDPEAFMKAKDAREKALYFPFVRILKPKDIKLGDIIAEGYYCTTHRGNVRGQEAAIKTFRSELKNDELNAVMLELKMLLFLGDHPNIVRLLGADFSQAESRIITAALEWCPWGDLHTYLSNALGADKEQKLSLKDGVHSHRSLTLTLIGFCEQIASAMENLESHNVVHGHLLAMSIFVYDENTVKISGPQYSKQLHPKGLYMPRKERRGSKDIDAPPPPPAFPWRWASIELLRNMQNFTIKSDVWAFGVTAWEIFSLGEIPYSEFENWSADFLVELELGKRLGLPGCAPRRICKTLTDCWKADPEERPAFAELKRILHQTGEEFRQAAVN